MSKKRKLRFELLLCVAVAVGVSVLGCGKTDTEGTGSDSDEPGRGHPVVVVPENSRVYQPIERFQSGSISGAVIYDGAAPPDSTITLTPDVNACGGDLVIHSFARERDQMVNAVVWLLDISIGRQNRAGLRTQLVKKGCVFSPEIIIARRGGTLNVFSTDAVVETATVLDLSTQRSIIQIPFGDPGQVIPLTHLLQGPSAYEIFVDSRPMSRSYMLVLDHPYHDVTNARGNFTLTQVPAGIYTLRAWHPRLGTVDKVVEVRAGQDTRVTARFPTFTEVH